MDEFRLTRRKGEIIDRAIKCFPWNDHSQQIVNNLTCKEHGNLQTWVAWFYYIDRCELWGFIREINSGISHVRYQFFSAGTTLTQLQVWCLRPFLCYGEYTYNCKLKKFREMLLTTLAHNQHDVIWGLPVWNVKIRRYLASCMFQFWSNLTKISFPGKHFNHFWGIVVNMTCRISHFQDGRSFQLNPLVSLLVDPYVWNEIYK
jgi:hypothetical protein